jgi:DNA-binding IclR family transcriptional regulator
MTTVPDPNKAKTARRVIEVLEFFDEQNRHATVMDIARRFKRPQSSTSELLAILVEMGLLYKDPNSRAFMPTPRAAMLGSLCQPSVVRDGRLSMMMDRLVAQTGVGAAVMGMVGLQVQMFRWSAGPKPTATSLANGLSGGVLWQMCDSAAGLLLLSTVPPERRDGVLRRLRAEAPIEHAFNTAVVREQIETFGRQGYALGPAGFGTTAQMCAILLPYETDERPMVVGLLHQPGEAAFDPQTLIAMLQKAVQECVEAADRIRHRPL